MKTVYDVLKTKTPIYLNSRARIVYNEDTHAVFSELQLQYKVKTFFGYRWRNVAGASLFHSGPVDAIKELQNFRRERLEKKKKYTSEAKKLLDYINAI